MWIHELTEPVPSPQLPPAQMLTATYGELHLGSSQVPTCPCNLSTHFIEIL